MSRTRSTTPLRARALQDAPELPHIIVRKPRRGDTLPISTRVLRGALRSFPSEYLVGLKAIELCPRPAEVGEPFACYRRGEKRIFLYSLPMSWSWSGASDLVLASMQRYGASIVTCDGTIEVRWAHALARTVWFVLEVLSHEVGHHHRYQNRFRRKQSLQVQDEEMGAQFHTWRIKETMKRNFRKRSNQAL
jgi:hypothetical protein